ncbi:hypothetical protein GQ600_10768 [Phytophthora cactorum]|nr:hypothetical protein GQ600_10768 [Phytophthora cactorum]
MKRMPRLKRSDLKYLAVLRRLRRCPRGCQKLAVKRNSSVRHRSVAVNAIQPHEQRPLQLETTAASAFTACIQPARPASHYAFATSAEEKWDRILGDEIDTDSQIGDQGDASSRQPLAPINEVRRDAS